MVLEDQGSLGYGLSDLALSYQSWMIIVGCREEVVLAISIPSVKSFGSPATLTMLFGLSSLKYWCWYSYRCWIITLIAMCVHIALALRLKLKL
jgi:hypothetical protein